MSLEPTSDLKSTPAALLPSPDLVRSIRFQASVQRRVRGERALGVILWVALGLVLVWQA